MEKVYDDWFINDKNEYVCECGRVFQKSTSFRSHRRFCNCHEHGYNYESKKKHIKNNSYVHIENYKFIDGFYKCECGKYFDKKESISAHFSHCIEHKQANNIKSVRNYDHKGTFKYRTKEELVKLLELANATRKKKIESGEIIYKSHKHTRETKEKLRLISIKKHEELGYSANYSKKACQYIDKLNNLYGWNLQHALNGGEIIVKGYYLDGYDTKLNIVFEYDEKDHYTDVNNSILRVKDQERQYIIMKHLGCRLFRYNETIDKLYEVIDTQEPICINIEDAINKKCIDYTSRKTIRDSLKKLGLSFKLYDLYVESHPNCGAISYPKRKKKGNKEKNIKETGSKIKINGMTPFQNNMYKLYIFVLNNIDKINLSRWDRNKQIKSLVDSEFENITNKQIKNAIRRFDDNLFNQIYNRIGMGSTNKRWVHNNITNETIRINAADIDSYLEKGWTEGRK